MTRHMTRNTKKTFPDLLHVAHYHLIFHSILIETLFVHRVAWMNLFRTFDTYQNLLLPRRIKKYAAATFPCCYCFYFPRCLFSIYIYFSWLVVWLSERMMRRDPMPQPENPRVFEFNNSAYIYVQYVGTHWACRNVFFHVQHEHRLCRILNNSRLNHQHPYQLQV